MDRPDSLEPTRHMQLLFLSTDLLLARPLHRVLVQCATVGLGPRLSPERGTPLILLTETSRLVKERRKESRKPFSVVLEGAIQNIEND